MKTQLYSAAVISMLASGVALAGARWGEQVTINGTTASGTLNSVKGSSDFTQWIGCQIIWTPVVTMGSCGASNSAGLAASCVTADPGAVDSIRALNSTSYVSFSWNGSGQCVRIQVSNMSGHIVP